MARQLFKRREEEWLILPAQGLNVADVDSSVISASLSVEQSQIGKTLSRLLVLIRNEGDKKVQDLQMILKAPGGLVIINPGEVFGVQEKRHKTGDIGSRENIRYKIDLKSRPEFRGGDLTFELRNPNHLESDTPYFTINLPLRANRI